LVSWGIIRDSGCLRRIGWMADEPHAGLQRAVELMTAWNEGDDSLRAVELVSGDLGVAHAQDRLIEDTGELVAGLMTLSAMLLHQLEQASGEPKARLLQAIGWLAAGHHPPSD